MAAVGMKAAQGVLRHGPLALASRQRSCERSRGLTRNSAASLPSRSSPVGRHPTPSAHWHALLAPSPRCTLLAGVVRARSPLQSQHPRRIGRVSATADALPSDAPSVSQATASKLPEVESAQLSWKWTKQGLGQGDGDDQPTLDIAVQAFSLAPLSPASTSVPGAGAVASPLPTILFLPAFSDVACADEWQGVAACLLHSLPDTQALEEQSASAAFLTGGGAVRVLSVDFPGFGGSSTLPLLYTADLMEDFLVDYVNHLFPDAGGAGSSGRLPLLLVGAGHTATVALRAVARGRLRPLALVAVAPTWAGPLPIVFGNEDKMLFRYSLLRGALRMPVIGPALYGYLTSEKNMKMQYIAHVYADPDNVSRDLVQRRTQLTRREGGRFAPASFVTGLLDPAKSREEFLELFAEAGRRDVPVAVLASSKSPKRSRREMEALKGAPGVAAFHSVPGSLLPHEEYPAEAAAAIQEFLASHAFASLLSSATR